MLSVAEARATVFRQAQVLPPVHSQIGLDRLGVTAEDAVSDLDSPPFDKSMMDGYAVRGADCGTAGAVLMVVGEVQAGAVFAVEVQPGEAVRIFTGAPIPPGTDAVVKQEDVTVEADGVRLQKAVKPGANVMRRGQEMKRGEVVIPAGTPFSATVFGLMAAVGKTSLWVVPLPKVGVIVTGNELVRASEVPTGGQIRNTNGPMLASFSIHGGGRAIDYGIVSDSEVELRRVAASAFDECDAVLFAGGVSVGKYDLVPDVLKSLGVQVHFHKVNMKPGKPLLFGTRGNTLVFGLPGNPVSALLGFQLFVGPAIAILGGRSDPGPKEMRLPLSEPLAANHDRPTYHPAVVGTDSVRPLPWQGSADLRALLPANGYVVLPPGEVRYEAGQVVDVIQTDR